MHGYAIVSMADNKGAEWCSLEAALSHIPTVGNLSRANSKSPGDMHPRIVEAEASARSECAKIRTGATQHFPNSHH